MYVEDQRVGRDGFWVHSSQFTVGTGISPDQSRVVGKHRTENGKLTADG